MALPVPLLHEQFILPPPVLRPVIQHLMLLSIDPSAGSAPVSVVRTLLPTFQVVMFINLGGTRAELWPAGDAAALVPVQQVSGTVVAGPFKTAWHYRLGAGARVLAVTFTLAGFFRLFQVPLERLSEGGLLDPDVLVGHRCFARLWEQLQPLAQPAQLVQALVNFCLPYLRAPEAAQAELLAQLPLLVHSPHLNPTKSLAAANRQSERTVQLRFQKYLGFSAKEAARFLRFRRVLAQLTQRGGNADKPDWLALLEHHGYHDQSHLIHDFTHFLHQSPAKVAVELLSGDAICVTRTALLGAASAE